MTAEEAIKEYPNWLKRKKVLELQIKKFKDTLDIDIIESLNFSQPQEEKIQTSGISDKTSKIAMVYREKVKEAEKESEERLKFLMAEYIKICQCINRFEYSISILNGELAEIMRDLIIVNLSWGVIQEKYNISSSTLARWRKKAIKELNNIYIL